MLSKLFNLIKNHQPDVVLTLAVILITVTSYNLGKISAFQSLKTPVTISEPNTGNMVRPQAGESELPNSAVVVSKKSKSKLYHFTWCPGAGQIAEANKLTFTNEQAAIAAGYTRAGNCKK